MGRKVFISVLGFSNYRECVYFRDEFKSEPVRFIQEATLQYLNSEGSWSSSDCVYILLTKGAEERNWLDNNEQEGLQSRLNKLSMPCNIVPVTNLPDGNTENEIWDIFEKIFSQLEEGDELYFDLTHGFRYLPMLVMVLINYSKVLKNIVVKSITYGNFEARNSDNCAPIVDLLSLSVLQDWTNAAAQYIDGGSIKKLLALSRQQLAPILREARGSNKDASLLSQFLNALDASVNDMQTCRGKNIVQSTNIRTLKSVTSQLETTLITPLNPIFEKIKLTFSEFSDGENVANGYVAVKWCLENGLYQQAITILQETIVTMMCMKNELDYSNPKKREIVNKAFNIAYKEIPEKEWVYGTNNENEKKEINSKIKEVISSENFSKFIKLFETCTEIRNDINHSGMRLNPSPTGKIINNIRLMFDKTLGIINDEQ